jgi:carboxylesterase type B
MNPGVDASDMSEDCLYLNVFTPAGQAAGGGGSSSSHTMRASSSSNLGAGRWSRQKEKPKHNLLPVLVWLHGGAFQQGAARRPEYDGRRLAERGVVVVTINYRLGALGFLVSASDQLYGNYGLMDQRAALYWIQDYIQYFGGDPNRVTLFGESAGAVMTGLHLLMDGAGKLFHKAILQSNPLGLQFRSVVVADFIGQALKSAVDCRDLACLRAERVEEILRAQSSLMGLPRSVGDFFTWGPVLTHELHLTLGASSSSSRSSNRNYDRKSHNSTDDNSIRAFPADPSTRRSAAPLARDHPPFYDVDVATSRRGRGRGTAVPRDVARVAVNVSQPLKNLDLIPDDIPVILGCNKHEGEMFVHGAFPIPMSKQIYWMFVGALFRDSATKVLKHYRGYVDQIEREAQALALAQIEEEENRQFYLDHTESVERICHMWAGQNDPNASTGELWPRGGNTEARDPRKSINGTLVPYGSGDSLGNQFAWLQRLWPFGRGDDSGVASKTREEEREERLRLRDQRRRARMKEKALKEAAKVVVDYRPVMSRIIDDYLFRCPTWHLAHELSRERFYRGKRNNVYVYQFSHSTHIPGFKECWGKVSRDHSVLFLEGHCP